MLTGQRTHSAIGISKATRVSEWALGRGVFLDAALGVGDHVTDGPFLVRCARALAIGAGDDELSATLRAHGLAPIADTRNWSLWERSTAPDSQ